MLESWTWQAEMHRRLRLLKRDIHWRNTRPLLVALRSNPS